MSHHSENPSFIEAVIVKKIAGPGNSDGSIFQRSLVCLQDQPGNNESGNYGGGQRRISWIQV